MDAPTGLEPFRDQSRADQIRLVVVGSLVCLVTYVGTAVLLFDLAILDHGGPDTPRRIVAAIASIVCWGTYAIAFVRGRGGPITTALVYPVATLGLVPLCVRWTRFGLPWDALRDRIAWFFVDIGLFVDAAALFVPGLSAFVLVCSIWASRLSESAIREWQRRHLPPEFRDAFVEAEDLDR